MTGRFSRAAGRDRWFHGFSGDSLVSLAILLGDDSLVGLLVSVTGVAAREEMVVDLMS
jgi:hypothetical protein